MGRRARPAIPRRARREARGEVNRTGFAARNGTDPDNVKAPTVARAAPRSHIQFLTYEGYAASDPRMTEIEYLLDRAQTCRKMAQTKTLSRETARLIERATEFERQAAILEARVSSREQGA
jgi:hypothetical protein